MPTSAQPQAARQLRLSSSSLGQAIPLVYGEQRIAGNLVFAMFFTAIPSTGGPTSGKAGGPTMFVSYTYTVTALLALGEGVLEAAITAVAGGTLSSGATTVTVLATAAFPDKGTLQIESERIRYTGRTATTFTGCTRGAEGTTAASHANATMVWSRDYACTLSADLALRQVCQVGRATPGKQAITISDKTGDEVKPQPEVGWEPAAWKTKKVRRLVDDAGDGLASDGDDKDTPKQSNFRPARFHNWVEDPDTHAATGDPRFITGVGDLIRGAWRNKQSPNPDGKFQKQYDAYVSQAGENYFGIACVGRQNMRLGQNASLPNWNFPFRGLQQYRDIYGPAVGGRFIYDADPACVLLDALTNPKHGAGWDRTPFPSMLQGFPEPWGARDLTPPADSWSAYCRAQNILISPLWDSQRAMADILSDLAELTNTAIVWSEGVLKMIPYGDTVATSGLTGVTFTPNTDPAATTDGANIAVRYALTMDDFIPGKNGDAVETKRRTLAPDVRADYKSDGLFNHVRVEFLNASNGYAVEVAEAKDDASISEVGVISREPYQYHDITQATVAAEGAARRLKKLVVVRNVYTFTLGWAHMLLEPMDVVPLPALAVGGTRDIGVRLTSITENDKGELEMEAEDFPQDVGAAGWAAPSANPTLPADELGGVIVGGQWALAPGFAGDGPTYNTLTGGLSSAGWRVTGAQVGSPSTAEFMSPHFPIALTRWDCMFTRRNELTGGLWSISAATLRVIVNGVASSMVLRFAYDELGASKTAVGRIAIPARTPVCIELNFTDPGGGTIFTDTIPYPAWFALNWAFAWEHG